MKIPIVPINEYKKVTSNSVSLLNTCTLHLLLHTYLPFNGKCSVIFCTVSLKEEESLTSETILCVTALFTISQAVGVYQYS